MLLAILAAAGLLGPAACMAKDGEIRESRADRDLREDRERALRDADRAREDALKDLDRDDDDSDDDDDDDSDDRSGSSNSGSGSGNSGSGSRSRRINVERDARGGDRQRDEVLLLGPDDSLPAVRRAGYTLISERRLESMQQTLVRVRVRDGQSVEQLMESLRALAPGARVAPNHIYNPSQQPTATAAPDTHIARPAAPGPAPARGRIDIGVIDTGADVGIARLRPLVQATHGFATGGYQPRSHGTAVAQLAAMQGANLAVADVFGVDRRNQLVAPAELVAAALDWMLQQRVRVVNISIEGPYNAVLEFVVQDAMARGMTIVAAAGNGGPAAAPAYPGAYAGVIAVTALDERGQVYRRAARGSHLQFAARGSYGVRQQLIETKVALAGTSFAAPVVAAAIAHRWRDHPEATRESILKAMRAEATDLGTPGHDAIYGWGRIEVTPKNPDQRPASASASLPL